MCIYFAYGSNMNPDRLKERIDKFNNPIPAILYDYEFFYGKRTGRPGRGFATIREKEDSIVKGIAFTIDEQAVKWLDYFEGVPKHYYKKEIRIQNVLNNKFFSAYTYISPPEMTSDYLRPFEDYKKHIDIGLIFRNDLCYNVNTERWFN